MIKYSIPTWILGHVSWEINLASLIKVLFHGNPVQIFFKVMLGKNWDSIIKVVFNKINMNLLIVIRIAKLNSFWTQMYTDEGIQQHSI